MEFKRSGAALVLVLGGTIAVPSGCVGRVSQQTLSASEASDTSEDGNGSVDQEAGQPRPIADGGGLTDGGAASVDSDASVADARRPEPEPLPPPRLGPPGTWNTTTPTDMVIGEFGVQNVVADPARPGDFYFTSYPSYAVYKSSDFGKTWSRVASDVLTQYQCAADPNPNRPADEELTIWCGGGYGYGIARSRDAGRTWQTFKTHNKCADSFGDDVYAIAVDPYDSRHLIIGFHGSCGISESFDGGETWQDAPGITGQHGTSNYPYFVDTGDPATTRRTWLIQSQWGDGDRGGINLTTDSGSNWKRVDSLQHPHGCSQFFDAGGGTIYAGGLDGSQGHGVYRSLDFGANWSRVNNGTMQNGVFGTPNYIYADYGWATGGEQQQQPQRSPRDQGGPDTWENYAPDADLKNGSAHAAIAFDPVSQHWVIVIAAWTGGILRYEEP